ncbi:TetR/AcrR family transcriptional regulator [Spiractinospora alimapuensis]|uniref:TetR/AcrR family transcriptional regulator n=1 Tax=Spiractinospora alimapuensis TaxID=2820884 RepID=UPI001F1BECE6|nr:TetR/AcrR family transcriptional regulator [Spiractinospora alimapuensis]QVQ50220.1 TetR/AcrR family transcriptional regulator [Spiractinospora alimapuensis]
MSDSGDVGSRIAHEISVSPTGGPPTHERADAALNRSRILAAAERLFSSAADPRAVTMGELASAAGVGRATLYRRYPDIGSVAVALLDEHERRLQEQILSGAPPLGPGAPPAERLAAFYTAALDLLDRHLHLVLGAETGPRRFTTGAYAFWRAHVGTLIARVPDVDREAVVDQLLAPLDPDLFTHQRDVLGIPTERLAQGLGWTARRLLT